jgi:hypothetical protein
MKKAGTRSAAKTVRLRSLLAKVTPANKPVRDPWKVPTAEEWLHKDPAALARVRKGLAQAGAGQTHYLGSFARYSGARITAPQRRRLEAGLKLQIRLYQQCLNLLPALNVEVYLAGMELFATEAALALWLCAPARAFAGKLPIRVARTAKGRKRVANLLGALAHGVFV